MSNLAEYQKKLEGMVADAAANVLELRQSAHTADACRCAELMNFELNGMCLALRATDEDAYAQTNFLDPEWIEQHTTEVPR